MIPKISIIIPCYNNESTIIETIESVYKQEYQSFEIIVVNDGSKDNSAEILVDYKTNNNKTNLHLINQENQGPSRSRNNGSDIAKGDYLLFLDADDIIAPSYIKKCIEILVADPAMNIVYSQANFFDAVEEYWQLPEFKFPDFLFDNAIYISAVIRNDVFKKVGKFDENLSFTEDWELWIRITKEFGGVYQIQEPLFFYRKRQDKSSLTEDKNNALIKDKSRLYIYNKHYALYKKYGLDIASLLLLKRRNDFYKNDGLDIDSLLFLKNQNEKYKKKYFSIWYKKLFYSIFKNRKDS